MQRPSKRAEPKGHTENPGSSAEQGCIATGDTCKPIVQTDPYWHYKAWAKHGKVRSPFWAASGQTWPRDPFQRVWLDKRCRTQPKPYKFIGFGHIRGPKPYKFIGFGHTHTGIQPNDTQTGRTHPQCPRAGVPAPKSGVRPATGGGVRPGWRDVPPSGRVPAAGVGKSTPEAFFCCFCFFVFVRHWALYAG